MAKQPEKKVEKVAKSGVLPQGPFVYANRFSIRSTEVGEVMSFIEHVNGVDNFRTGVLLTRKNLEQLRDLCDAKLKAVKKMLNG